MNILFIGNSHTYVNYLPYQVKFLLKAGAGLENDVRMVTVGGKSLGWHADQPNTRAALVYHSWDIIVLQQATHPWAGSDTLIRDYEALEPLLAKTGADILAYITWARKERPEDQAEIDSSFERLAADKQITPVPVSRAWQQVIAEMDDVDLYSTDGSHAGEHGTYLAASVFYSVISGKSPAGLPSKTVMYGDVLADIPPDIADGIHEVITRMLTES